MAGLRTTIQVTHDHSLPLGQAYTQVQRAVDAVARRYGWTDAVTWNGALRKGTLDKPGVVNATVRVLSTQVVLQGTLFGPAVVFRGKIKTTIQTQLAKVLP